MPDLRTHRYRVAKWATGTIGTHALRSSIEHPHLELTAVHVFGADKVGTDADELCGLGPAGITATDRIEAILDATTDCADCARPWICRGSWPPSPTENSILPNREYKLLETYLPLTR